MSDATQRAAADLSMRVAKRLAFPRYSGTAGNHQAVELVSRWFHEADLEVTREEFTFDVRPAFRALRIMLLVAAALLGSAAILIGSQPGVALLAVILALCGGGGLLSWSPWLERLYRRRGCTRAANVEGRRAAAPDGLLIILLAHHDSKSQNLTLPFRALATVLALAAGLGLLVISALRTLSFGTDVESGLVPSLGLVAVISLGALSTLRNGNRSPGGVDNAGSVGLLVELAHLLPGRVPEDVELVFLSPGAEEDHMVGAMRWLERHEQELSGRRVWALNIDGAGIPGRVTLLERYGLGKWFSRRLSAVARSASSGLGIPIRGILIPPAMGVDAIPFAHRGIPCLTLTSGSLGRASLSVHSKNDRFEHLDAEALAEVRDLVVAMVEVLVSGREQGAGVESPAPAGREAQA